MDQKTISIKISLEEVTHLLKSLSRGDKELIMNILEEELFNAKVKEPKSTYLLSEKSLAKDWLTPEEDEAWKNL